MKKRLTPADFGALPDDDWVEPEDDLVEFLHDDPEVDWTNKWVRRGARDEIAGRSHQQNPYSGEYPPNITRADWRGWRDGWISSANFHGRMNRPAYREWQDRMREYMRIQGLIDFGVFRKRGEPDPPNPYPAMPENMFGKRPRD